MESRLREVENKVERMEMRVEKIENTVHQQEIQFAETKVYVKEIYKKLDSITSTVEYLKTSATRSREDFITNQTQTEATVRVAEARAEASAIRTEARSETATVRVEANSATKWQNFYAKAFWVMLGIITTILIAVITTAMHPAVK